MIDEALAARVARELQRAGLQPVTREKNPTGGFGIQPLEEMLHVGWNPSPELSEKVIQKITAGDIGHPAVRHSGTIDFAMAEAIATILQSAGMNARLSEDDLSPGVVEVS